MTENGSACPDEVVDGTVADLARADFLEAHVAAAARAVGQGVPLAGYFAWSLLDNFEWSYGYAKRFGLVHVDYETEVRTVKDSGRRYAKLIREHAALTTPGA